MQAYKDNFAPAAVVLTLMITLAVRAQLPPCTTYTGTDVGPIPKSGTEPVATFSLNVTDDVRIRDVNIMDLKGTHTWGGDLDFYLTSPGGTIVHFRQQACSFNDNFNFKVDDEAPPGFPPCPPTDGGTYRSTGNGDGVISNVQDSNVQSTLSAFKNERSAGTWTLTIVDRFINADDGQLERWALEICGQTSVSVAADDLIGTEKPTWPFDFARFRISLDSGSSNLSETLVVSYSVEGTAENGVDYTFLNGEARIFSCCDTTTIPINITDDILVEGNETVLLTLTGTNNPNISVNPENVSATAIIFDNDATTVSIKATDASSSEDPIDHGQFTVALANGKTAPSQGIDVNYKIGGTADNGVDYELLISPVTIPSGASSATIDVNIIDDPDGEGTETVNLMLTGSDHPDVEVDSANATDILFIADDENANIIFDQSVYSCSRLISVTIVDPNAQAESIKLVVSTGAGDSETLVAVDPEGDNVYTASISMGDVTDFPLPGDEKIQGFQVDTITGTYFDDADFFGNPATIINTTLIDCQPPAAPSVISDPPTGNTTFDSTITLVWDPGDDGADSGVAGYSWVVDRQPGTEPDAIPEPNGLPNEITIGLLGVGDYWLHIHAFDLAGNKSQTLHIGPWIIIGGPDGFEDDDSPENATDPYFSDSDEGEILQHNFHDDGDEDWIAIGAEISLKIFDIGANNDLILEIYENLGTLQFPEKGNLKDSLIPNGEGNIIISDIGFIEGTLLRIRNGNGGSFGVGTDYKIVFDELEQDFIFSGKFTFSPEESAPNNAFLIIADSTATISSNPFAGSSDLNIANVEPIAELSPPNYEYFRLIGGGEYKLVANAPNFRPIAVNEIGIINAEVDTVINFQFQANPMTYIEINEDVPIFNEVIVNDLDDEFISDTGVICTQVIENRHNNDSLTIIHHGSSAPQISTEGDVIKFENTVIGNVEFNNSACSGTLAVNLDFESTNISPAQAIEPLIKSIGFQTTSASEQVRTVQVTLRMDPLVYSTTRDIVPTAPFLDVDGDGVANVFVDGIIIVRFMFNIRGDDLINGVIDPSSCSRCTADDIEAYLELAKVVGAFDADQSGGDLDAFVDGVNIVRFLAGIRGAGLSDTDPEGIVTFLTPFLPP